MRYLGTNGLTSRYLGAKGAARYLGAEARAVWDALGLPAGPTLPPLSTGRLAVGLTGLADWTAGQPFADVFRTARRNNTVIARDGGGWPVEPTTYLMLWDQQASHTDLAGRYRLTWDGNGTVSINGPNQDTSTPNQIEFDFTPTGTAGLNLQITATDPAPNNVRNIKCIQTAHLASYNAGDIYRPEWKATASKMKLVRFMDWQGTNNSAVTDYATAQALGRETWRSGYGGPPLSVLVDLCNEFGVEPWFCMPHLATDDYVTQFATYVRDNLRPDVRAHVEYSNEFWNFQFGQTQWLLDQAEARWGSSGGGRWMQYGGMRAAEMMRIWGDVFGAERAARVVRVCAVQTGYQGLEQNLLNAPEYVAEDPANNQPPKDFFDAYAVTNYFDGTYSYNVAPWNTVIAEYNANGEDAAYRMMYDNIIQDVEGTRRDNLLYHRGIADDNGFDLITYEGGSHVAGSTETTDDALARDILHGFHASDYMGQLYKRAVTIWSEIGDGPFNQFTLFTDTRQIYPFAMKPNSSVPDQPRTDVLNAYNLGLPLPSYNIDGYLPLDSAVAMNGHSITNRVRGGERAFREAEGSGTTKYHYMLGPYSTAAFRYNNRNDPELTSDGSVGTREDGLTSPEAWADGDYDALITIVASDGNDGGILRNFGEPEGLASLFDLFFSLNAGARGYLLTFWNNRFAGDAPTAAQWRADMAEDQGDWVYLRDFVEAADVGGPVEIIPFLDLMGLTYDETLAGNGPAGWTIADDLMDDGVHQSTKMSWAGAVLIAAKMYGLDPANAPLDLSASTHSFGTNTLIVSQAEKDFLVPLIQQVVASGYDLSSGTPVAGAPARPAAPSGAADSETEITWTLPADPDDNGASITSRDLRVQEADGAWTEHLDITSPVQTTGHTAATGHYGQWRAGNSEGDSQWSPSSALVTTQAAAGGGTVQTPQEILGADATYLFDPSLGGMFTDNAVTAAGDGDPVDYLPNQIAGTDPLRATGSAARPTYEVVGSSHALYFDNTRVMTADLALPGVEYRLIAMENPTFPNPSGEAGFMFTGANASQTYTPPFRIINYNGGVQKYGQRSDGNYRVHGDVPAGQYTILEAIWDGTEMYIIQDGDTGIIGIDGNGIASTAQVSLGGVSGTTFSYRIFAVAGASVMPTEQQRSDLRAWAASKMPA